MDWEEFQEKMDPAHRTYLCRMLKVKDLPEHLLVVYQTAKILADRIDARLLPGNLAVIAMIGGEGPIDEAVDDSPKALVDEAASGLLEQPAAQPVAQGQVSGVTGQQMQQIDEAVKETLEQTSEQTVEEAAEQIDRTRENIGLPEKQPEAQPAPTGPGTPESSKFWSPGMPVNVLQEDELKLGKIVGIHRSSQGSEKPLRLTVEFEPGETITVNEDEVEAV